MFGPEDKGATILRNVGIYLPNDKSSHAKNTTAAPLCEKI